MKVNPLMLVVSLLVGGMMFYGFWAATDGNLAYSLTPSLVGLVLLATSLAVRIANPRLSALIKIVSGIFWAVALVMNILLVIWTAALPALLISNGILLCVWLVLVYAIGRSKK